jgi:prolyl-tRNA editing enzyme YbaK/EbsC (Cys-tRNA(Pro) deacylase)
MNISLGTLKFLPAIAHPELLAATVATGLARVPGNEAVGVAEIDPTLSDTAAFCEHYQIGMEQAANCVVLEAKRGDKSWYAACVILGSTRADVNGVARKVLDAKKASFAAMEQAVAQSNMEYGAITPVGLPSDWTILIDQAVADSPYVIIGSGIRSSKLAVPGAFLAALLNAKVIPDLAKTEEPLA